MLTCEVVSQTFLFFSRGTGLLTAEMTAIQYTAIQGKTSCVDLAPRTATQGASMCLLSVIKSKLFPRVRNEGLMKLGFFQRQTLSCQPLSK
jgi:hypothetical protein